jgi:hypothetical protein
VLYVISEMKIFSRRLKQPRELKKLIAERLWPATHNDAIQQNLQRRISPECVHRLIPTEDEIFLYPDPSMTLASEHEASRKKIGETEFFAAYDRSLDQIDPQLALFIADFGHGSDAPIALDFRSSIEDPPVIGLKWHNMRIADDLNQWVRLADRFSDFVRILELTRLPKFKR